MTTALRMALRDVGADRQRSILTAAAVIPIVAAYLILLGVAAGLREGQETSISPNILLVAPDALDPGSARLGPEALEVAAAAAAADAVSVSPIIFRPIRIGEHVLQLRAAPLDTWKEVQRIEVLRGSLPVPGADEIAITEGVAITTGWAPGDEVAIYGTTFTVTGLVRAGGTRFASVWMSYERADRLFEGATGFQMVTVRPAPGADPQELRDRLAGATAGSLEVFFEGDLAAAQSGRIGTAWNIAVIATGIGVAALAFTIFNLTALTLAERRRDVGIARTLGFSSAALGAVIALRSVVLALAGFAGGAVIAIGVTAAAPATTLRSVLFDVRIPASAWGLGLALCVVVPAVAARLAHRTHARRPLRSLLESP